MSSCLTPQPTLPQGEGENRALLSFRRGGWGGEA